MVQPGPLRDYLNCLRDLEAEDASLDDAAIYPAVHKALRFLLVWPDLDCAAKEIEAPFAEFNRDHYETLTPMAEVLATYRLLVTALALRSMIDFALTAACTRRFLHAARHLAYCQPCAAHRKIWCF